MAAAQGLYEIEIAGTGSDVVLLNFLQRRWDDFYDEKNTEQMAKEVKKLDKNTLYQIIEGVTENKDKIDTVLSGAIDGDRDFMKLDILLQSILRAAVFELYFVKNVPMRVVIDEYVDLTHAFYSENEPFLVNGMLDKIGKYIRENELG